MNQAADYDLQRLQRWMQAVITHPEGIVGGVDSSAAREEIDVSVADVEQVIAPSQALDSIARLQVYGSAFFARLLECLQSEFPSLLHAVGEETFGGFAFGYLQAYPSKSYTLNELGALFPQYLSETRPARESGAGADWADFLVDLARLERAYSEVFDGPGVEGQKLLSTEDVLGIGADQWAKARLRTVPCLRLEAFGYPVHEYATAVRNRRPSEGTVPIPAAAPTYLVITRRDFVVRRFPVSQAAFVLLRALADGQSVGDAVAQAVVQSDADLGEFSADLRRWFEDWTAAGLFSAVQRTSLRS